MQESESIIGAPITLKRHPLTGNGIVERPVRGDTSRYAIRLEENGQLIHCHRDEFIVTNIVPKQDQSNQDGGGYGMVTA